MADTVFDLPLEAIRVPLLLVGHAADKCVRSSPQAMDRLAARTTMARRQLVTVEDGPGWPGAEGVEAYEGLAPHGYVDHPEQRLHQGRNGNVVICDNHLK